jgi:hypothetical protein
MTPIWLPSRAAVVGSRPATVGEAAEAVLAALEPTFPARWEEPMRDDQRERSDP